ncbi:MAG: DUF294 nucleotidyltransferase-like domain-containing protein [Myxococcales bacterium]
MKAAPALDPVAFLRATPPFDRLPRPAFESAARALEIVFLPAGTRLLAHGDAPLAHLYVIRKGAVRLERSGETVQVLEEGELVGLTSLFSGTTPLDATVLEDVLAYRISRAALHPLLADPAFAAHFASGLADRLRHSLERTPDATYHANFAAPVGSFVRRPPVRVPAHATVGEAARAMRDAHVTSVLVDSSPAGIVTDRDLRNRVLAEDLGPATPIVRVQSAPLRSLRADAPLHEAWQFLLEEGVHHLPLTRGGEIVGVVNSSDLLRLGQGPLGVVRSVDRLGSRGELPGYAGRIAKLAARLSGGGLDAPAIAALVARLNDALLRRVLAWAHAELGPAPCDYAWLVLGSEGRREQLLLTDQDNALVFASDGAEPRRYFTAFAERVAKDLLAAGFPECPGGYMATRWQGTTDEWEQRLRGWLAEPRPRALLDASVFLDFRRAGGTLPLEGLEELAARTGRERIFLAALAKLALSLAPPGALAMRLRHEIDLKLHCVGPMVALARCHALEVGSRARGTLERLAAAAEAGLLSAEDHANLDEAYRFFLRLHLREQLRGRGRQIPLSDLSIPDRRALKDSLAALREWQTTSAYHYRTEYV